MLAANYNWQNVIGGMAGGMLSKIVVTFLLLMFFLTSCGGGGSSTDDDPIDDSPSENDLGSTVFTQFTHPDDSLILTAETISGEKLAYYGYKNANGKLTALDSVRVQTPEQFNEGTATWLHFSRNGQISRIDGDAGTVFGVNQVSDLEFALSLVSADGEIQVNTVTDLGTSEARGHEEMLLQQMGVPNHWPPDNGDIVVSNSSGSALLQEKSTPYQFTQSSNAANVQVSVSECASDRAVNDAEVYITASSPGDPVPPTFLAVDAGNGRYNARIPLGNKPMTAEAVTKACNATANALSASCESTANLRQAGPVAFCGFISASLDVLVGGPTGEAALIFAECQAGYLALQSYCSTVGVTPTGLSTGHSEGFCENIGNIVSNHAAIQNAVDMNQLEAQAYVKLPGREIQTSDPVTINPFTEEFPRFDIDLGSIITINEVSVSPTVPLIGKSYSVTANLSCSENSAVAIDVSRSNGVTAKHEFTPTDDKPITIQVDASDSGRDVIRVLAVSPEVGPFGFLTASREIVVELQDKGTQCLLNENSLVVTWSNPRVDAADGSFFPACSYTFFADKTGSLRCSVIEELRSYSWSLDCNTVRINESYWTVTSPTAMQISRRGEVIVLTKN